MNNLKVILLTDVKKQGKKDQVIDVSDGYANNFLISKGLAVPYNTQNKNKLERDLKSRSDEEAALVSECEELKKRLASVTVNFIAKTGKDGKMFGSIYSKQISDEKKITCNHTIDSLGVHVVDINLHKRVIANINVHVE